MIGVGMELFLVSRNLERVADLATNIGEDVVFLVEGKSIKHHAEDRGEAARMLGEVLAPMLGRPAEVPQGNAGSPLVADRTKPRQALSTQLDCPRRVAPIDDFDVTGQVTFA